MHQSHRELFDQRVEASALNDLSILTSRMHDNPINCQIKIHFFDIPRPVHKKLLSNFFVIRLFFDQESLFKDEKISKKITQK